MCFIRVSPKHAPINPPGAAPTLTSIYDRPFLDTSIDMENPTAQGIVKSLDVDEKLHPVRTESGDDIELQPARTLSQEEVQEKTERKVSLPQRRRASRASATHKPKETSGGRSRKSSKHIFENILLNVWPVTTEHSGVL